MPLLNSIVDAAPFFKNLFPVDCVIMTCDSQGILVGLIQAKSFHMEAIIGEKAASGGTLDECLKTRKEVNKVLPRAMYGFSVKAISLPIYEEGQFVGAVAIGVSLETQQSLQDAAQTIAATSEELTATAEEIAANASALASDLDRIKENSNHVQSSLKKTDNILKFVSDVAANSNLLGLNAAIEAARAGEHGRGFAVVADEIRKMAVNSAQAVKDIKGILGSIQSDSIDMLQTIEKATRLGESQAAATQEISASMQQLAASAMNVEKIAEII